MSSKVKRQGRSDHYSIERDEPPGITAVRTIEVQAPEERFIMPKKKMETKVVFNVKERHGHASKRSMDKIHIKLTSTNTRSSVKKQALEAYLNKFSSSATITTEKKITKK